jgi:transcriptional regulator with XRE-family HTH domain
MPTKMAEVMQEPEKTPTWNTQRLIFQRKGAMLSPKQLAQVIGVTQNQVVCMENCTRIPSKEMLGALVSFFDVPEDYFGVEALDGQIDIKPAQPLPQDARQQAAKEKLAKQRHALRKMMKIAGFSFTCSGLRSLAEAIDESIFDTCGFVNGELEMPPDTVRKANTWFASIR